MVVSRVTTMINYVLTVWTPKIFAPVHQEYTIGCSICGVSSFDENGKGTKNVLRVGRNVERLFPILRRPGSCCRCCPNRGVTAALIDAGGSETYRILNGL